jgi:ElaA protein
MTWRECGFAELSVHELYEVLQLRSEVFVLEQACAFQDMDGKDQHARHLLGRTERRLLAYARLFGPGECYAEASIGRVVTAAACRRTGVGKQLIREAIAAVERHWGSGPIRIGAQAYLERFYESFGFVRDDENYLEDGIPHLYMVRPFGAVSESTTGA